tara:strand:+ start:170 stop:307 length:138 start_codon:yes stop_codon:yes gene_type:complete
VSSFLNLKNKVFSLFPKDSDCSGRIAAGASDGKFKMGTLYIVINL